MKIFKLYLRGILSILEWSQQTFRYPSIICQIVGYSVILPFQVNLSPSIGRLMPVCMVPGTNHYDSVAFALR